MLSAEQLKAFLLKLALLVVHQGENIVSHICVYCPLNQKACKFLECHSKVVLLFNRSQVFLVHDFVPIFENIRDNLITKSLIKLVFAKEKEEYLASWNDVAKLCDVDT